MKALAWIGRNLLGLLALGVAFWAWALGEDEVARYFVVLAALLGISQQVDQLRNEIRKHRCPECHPRPEEASA